MTTRNFTEPVTLSRAACSVYIADGIRSGFGIYAFSDGARYIGEFAGDLREGEGRYLYPGGEEYVGPFVGGKKHGIGTRIYPNGSRVQGLWKDDQHIRDIAD